LFVKALGVGLVLAVPLGPIGLLCLRRSLSLGMAAGLATGLGAATADAIYAAIAAFALGAVSPWIADLTWLGIAGGAALIGLCLRDIMQGEAPPVAPTLSRQMGAWAGAVLLTLTNPATILTFAAIIVGLGLLPDLAAPLEGAIFVAGVFLGSALWWVVLSGIGGRLGDRLPPAAIRWTRRIAGIAFIAFGVYAIAS
jgi:putative LysE/RhtB family amino acid efflux pump